jgi:hypothetical protein
MSGQTSKSIVLCTVAGAVTVLSGCGSSPSAPAPQILTQPQSQTVEKGSSSVSFSVVATNFHLINYQWQFNGSNISGANSPTYTIPHPVDFTDVGEYRVEVWGSPTNVSQPAMLSVYSASAAMAVGAGTLSTPIGSFTTQNPTYTCSSGGTFNKGYTPLYSSGQPMFFYGPNARPQTGIFQNTLASSLTIDTFSSDNGTADTGIRLQENWVPFADAGCNDNAPAGSQGETCALQSKCTIPLSQAAGPVAGKNTYRLTILYKQPPGPPTSGKITFNWRYQ